MSAITLRNLCKTYPESANMVVDHIDLEIKNNEFLVLVGPSGCGKTTTLRMIAGLEEISGGELYFGDRLMNKLPPKDRNVSMVFQNYALYPHLNVHDNLAFGLKHTVKDKEERAARVKEMLTLLELTHLANNRPAALSGGQRQRVAMGRALVRDTDVLLMDEPLSNLDAKLRVQMRAEILSLHERIKRTVVYVTHDQVEAMTMGDRIAVMYGGIIQQIDTPANIFERPANLFVAGFIGSPPMNFFDCELTEREGALRLCGQGFDIPLPPKMDSEKMRRQCGRACVLGVRPENIRFCEEHPDIKAQVEVAQILGDEAIISLKNGENTFFMKTEDLRPVRYGQAVALSFDSQALNVFDKESQKNLC